MNRTEHKKLVADALQRLSDHALDVKTLVEDETVEMTDDRLFWSLTNLGKDVESVKLIDRAAETIMRAESPAKKDITAPPK